MRGKPPRRAEAWGAAKVNIGWHVGDRRPDGYHDVCGLLQAISLCDRLEISVGPQGDVPARVSVPGHPELGGASNLVARAAAALAEHVDPPPTSVVVHKAIPVAAGLGGGSADAAAALAALNAVWGAGRTARQLLRIAAEVGSDVPGILLGGLVHVSGRGEAVRRVGAPTEGWFVLGTSDEGVATAEAYEVLDLMRKDGTAAESGTTWHGNDLADSACRLVEGLGSRLDAMRRAAGVAFVAGSGPTVVGVVADEAHARDVVARVRDTFSDVLLARPSTWGARVTVGGDAETRLDARQ